jgi:hypothetical protein
LRIVEQRRIRAQWKIESNTVTIFPLFPFNH